MTRKSASSFEKKILAYIKKWEGRGYSNGIPDEADANLEALIKAPSYRAICMAIVKNDVQLTSLGYSRPKSFAYMTLKQIEIEERNSHERLRRDDKKT
jgi:predicted phosphoadenosine phosphosulfate sulfurtransferase